MSEYSLYHDFPKRPQSIPLRQCLQVVRTLGRIWEHLFARYSRTAKVSPFFSSSPVSHGCKATDVGMKYIWLSAGGTTRQVKKPSNNVVENISAYRTTSTLQSSYVHAPNDHSDPWRTGRTLLAQEHVELFSPPSPLPHTFLCLTLSLLMSCIYHFECGVRRRVTSVA